MATALLGERTRDEVWAGPIIDADVHANVPSLQTLIPYMPGDWGQFTRDRGWAGPAQPGLLYPPNAPSTARDEWRPEGRVPASDVTLLQEHVLEPWRTETAIVNCYYGVDSLRHPDWAPALAAAVNDWLIAEWLEKDDRLRASMVVPARDPAAAVREIERVGDHGGFVQVLMPVRSDRLYGARVWHPVYDAMVRRDLVMGLHFGGTTDDAPTPSGWPSWYAEEYAGEWHNFASQVASLVAEGVFRVFPELRVSVLEGGFTWVPAWSWRMTKPWKGLRREVPWVDRPPVELVREHMRFSTAPMDAGPPEHLARVIEWLGSEDMLMFATDYPHFHDDDLGVLLDAAPDTMRAKIMSETARAWYRL